MSDRNWTITTAAQYAASAPKRFERQYRDSPDERRFAQGDQIGEIRKALAAISDPTPEAIEAVLGEQWAKPWCTWCNEWKPAVVDMNDSDSCAPMCLECASLAVQRLKEGE